MTHPAAAVVLVFLHLLVAPCAAAMVWMTAADCEHCQAVGSSGECVASSDASTSALGNGLANSNNAEPQKASGKSVTRAPATLTGPLAAPDTPFRARPSLSRRTGDPPLYILLGQLLI